MNVRQLISFLLIVASSIFAAPPASLADAVQKDLEQFKVEDWTQRSAGFYDVVHQGVTIEGGRSQFPPADGILALLRHNVVPRPKLSKALIDLLAIETDLMYSGKGPSSEDFSEYFADLIMAVSILKDKTAMPTLFRCINTGGMAMEALAGFGDDTLTTALKLLPSDDWETRHSLFDLIAYMAVPKNFQTLSSDSQNKLLAALIKGASDADYSFRVIAASGLSNFSSPEAVQVVRKLAQEDKYSVTDGKITRYPVREAAAQALEKQQTSPF